MKRFGLLIGVALLSGCAKQGLPPGGPEDKVPPQVINTVPAPEALRVVLDTPIEIVFSESIQAKAVEEAVFITPYPGKDVAVRIRGRVLSVRFPQPFKPGITYVVTVGTAVTDLRGNPLAQSYTLAFSTGERLDQGRIRGRVVGQADASGIDVWAYRVEADPDPYASDPDYIVQCGKDGAYAFSHLAPGGYRLFAVQDRLADRRYQPVEDQYGATFRDAMLTDSTRLEVDGLNFRLTREDTLRPTLLRAEPLDSRAVRLHFDKPVDGASLPRLRILAEGDTAQAVVVEAAYVEPSALQNLYVLTEPVTAGQKLVAWAYGLRDTLGLVMDTASATADWTVPQQADTTAPKLTSVTPAPGLRGLPLVPVFRLDFSEPLDTLAVANHLALRDSAGQAVPLRHRWTTPLRLSFSPQARLAGRMAYALDLSGGWVRDRVGQSLADTVMRWTTLNPDTLSQILGAVWDQDPEGRGAIWVAARSTTKDGPVYSRWIPGCGDYRLEDVLPGLYVLECFRDRDGNGRYSHGRLKPFVPAERFMVRQDTLKIRARWPNEGNDLLLR